LDTFFVNGITVTNTQFTGNPYYDLSAYCNYPVDPFYNYVTLLFPDVIPSATPTNPTYASFSVDSQCIFRDYKLEAGTTTSFAPPTKGNNPKISATIARYITLASKSRLEFNISCDNGQTSFTVPLPNGDKVEIVCPMHGKATISRLDSTILPDELPAGYTYASAFQLDISKSKVENGEFQTELIPVITEGGYIKASFVPTPLQPGRTFAVLFWDANTSQWIPLKDFAVGHSYKLVPGDSNDSRVIRSGVQLVSTGGARRVEVSTNFPGIFVLVQH